jgi:transketolase
MLRMAHVTKSSHIGTGLSMVEALVALYFRILNVDPANPSNPNRDKFVLSKAHGSMALYAVLAERGFFGRELLDRFYVDGGTLPAHLDRLSAPGIETSGGSLGHGLGLGIGMATANLYDSNPGRIYVLLGDGECNEGSVWEAFMLAPQLKLANLTALIDFNFIQSLGRTNEIIDQSNLSERLRAFGWDATDLDGHDLGALIQALSQGPGNKPRALVMSTVKGKGVSFMEDKLLWHYRSPNEEELRLALEELA